MNYMMLEIFFICEYVGWAHEKLAKFSMSKPNSLFCY